MGGDWFTAESFCFTGQVHAIWGYKSDSSFCTAGEGSWVTSVYHSETSLIHVSLAHIFTQSDPFHTLLVTAASFSVLSVKKWSVTSSDIFMAP